MQGEGGQSTLALGNTLDAVTTIRKGNDEVHFQQVHEHARKQTEPGQSGVDSTEWKEFLESHPKPIQPGIHVPDQKGHIDEMLIDVTGDKIPGLRIAYHPVPDRVRGALIVLGFSLHPRVSAL